MHGLELSLKVDAQTYRVNVEEKTTYRLKRGVLWTGVTVRTDLAGEVRVGGLPNVQGSTLTQALQVALVLHWPGLKTKQVFDTPAERFHQAVASTG